MRRAYALAERHFDNRVILATDGDFNVGITDPKELERFIAEKRKTGIYLSSRRSISVQTVDDRCLT